MKSNSPYHVGGHGFFWTLNLPCFFFTEQEDTFQHSDETKEIMVHQILYEVRFSCYGYVLHLVNNRSANETAICGVTF